jgi:AcrR family transcriptional regulator
VARPQSIDDEQILAAAREVFLERGPMATTLEVARRAGVSEGTIFKRFATKDELLVESMRLCGPALSADRTVELLAMPTLRDALEALVQELLAFYRTVMPRMALMASCHLPPSKFFAAHDEPPPVQNIKALMLYVRAEQRAGRMRDCDPEVVARSLVGATMSYCFAEQHGINNWLPMADSTYVRGIVDQILNGVAPRHEGEL